MLQEPSTARIDWSEALERACRRPGTVRAHFQPIADLRRGVVCGFEALARFAGPPVAPPNLWFAAAGAHGVSDRLEARALEAALTGRPRLPPNCFLTVNLSPGAIVSEECRAVLDREGRLDALVIEVTEQTASGDPAALARALEHLRERGALVAVDDAGSGYASLRRITALRPQLVKIDGALVGGLDADPAAEAAIEALGGLAGRLDAWVLAEGIERVEELDRLVALGVPLGQGYLLGRPAEAMAAEPLELGPRIRGRAQARRRGGGVDTLVESCPAVENGEGAQALFDAEPALEWVAAVDPDRRPVGLAARSDALDGRPWRPALCADAGEEAADLARRAMVRRAPERFDPILMCDERGRLSGMLRVERLVARLAG